MPIFSFKLKALPLENIHTRKKGGQGTFLLYSL